MGAWEAELSPTRASVEEEAARLAQPGPIDPLRSARHWFAIGAAQLGWLVRRVPGDLVHGLRPLRDPVAWMQDSVAYVVRDQLAMLGPAAAEAARIIDESDGIAPRFLVDELHRRPVRTDPLPSATIERLADRAFGGDITRVGRPISATPFSQLNEAELGDGEPVYLRIRRPGAARTSQQDIRILATLLTPFERAVPAVRDAHPLALVALAARQVLEESDLRNEALNAVHLGLLAEELGIDGVSLCAPLPGLVQRRATVFEPLGHVVPLIDGLARLDRRAAGTALVRLTIEGALAAGIFQADLRPEQFVVLQDGGLGIVGCGTVGRFDVTVRRSALDLLPAVLTGDGPGLVRAMEGVGAIGAETDVDALLADLAGCEALQARTILAGGEGGLFAALQEAIAILLRHHVYPPVELMLFVRTVLSLRALLRVVDPDLTMMAALMPLVPRLPQLRAELS